MVTSLSIESIESIYKALNGQEEKGQGFFDADAAQLADRSF